MRFLPHAALLLCLAAALPVVAEESVEDVAKKLNTKTTYWSGFAPGSWIEFHGSTLMNGKDSGGDSRQTLVSEDETGAVIDGQSITITKNADGSEKRTLGEKKRSTYPAGATAVYSDLKELPREELQIGKRAVACRVFESKVTYTYPAAMGGNKIEQHMTIWWSPEIKVMNGIVKSQGDTKADAFSPAKTLDGRIVELDRPVKVGDRTILCAVWRFTEVQTNDESIFKTWETWCSPEIPYGQAHLATKKEYGKANPMKMEITSDVIGMELVPAAKGK